MADENNNGYWFGFSERDYSHMTVPNRSLGDPIADTTGVEPIFRIHSIGQLESGAGVPSAQAGPANGGPPPAPSVP